MRYVLCVETAAVMLSASVNAKDVTVPQPLPEAFSNFRACVSDGFAYAYGGHTSKTHCNSTESVIGKFRRLNLSDPAKR